LVDPEGESRKRLLLSASISLSLRKTKDYNMIGFTGWFNSFDINNWHGSLRKMKNCNKEESGKKRFHELLSSRKRACIFWQKVLRKMYGKEQCQERKAKRVNCEN
jgi:hypothetical protein